MLICHCFIHEKIVRETHWKLEAVARVKLLDLLLQISQLVLCPHYREAEVCLATTCAVGMRLEPNAGILQ